MNIIKIGTVELTPQEAEQLYNAGKYIVTYSTIYKLIKTPHFPQVHGKAIHKAKGMTRRGRFYAMDAETVNNVFGINLA